MTTEVEGLLVTTELDVAVLIPRLTYVWEQEMFFFCGHLECKQKKCTLELTYSIVIPAEED